MRKTKSKILDHAGHLLYHFALGFCFIMGGHVAGMTSHSAEYFLPFNGKRYSKDNGAAAAIIGSCIIA